MLFSTAVSLVSEKDKNLTSYFSFFVNIFFFSTVLRKLNKRTIATVKVLNIAVHSVTVLSSRKPSFPPLTHYTSTSCTSTSQTFPRIHSDQCIHDVTVPLSLYYETMATIYIMIYILHINTSDDGYFMLLSSVVCSEQQ